MSSMVQLLCAGGVVSPARLEVFARACVGAGVREVLLSPRQSMLAVIPRGTRESVVRRFDSIAVESHEKNCMSSAWESGRGGWLSEGNLLGIVDGLAADGLRDVGIVGPGAAQTPRLSSRINCVAAELPHHWHVILRAGFQSRALTADFLLPTFALRDALRATIALGHDVASDAEALRILSAFAAPLESREAPVEDKATNTAVAEGIVVEPDGSVSITILAEVDGFAPEFLDELAYLSRRHRAGRIQITPDHRLIVRQLSETALFEWRELLERRRISLRHDSCDLNWRVEPDVRALQARLVPILRRRRARRDELRIAIGSEDVAPGADLWLRPGSFSAGPARVFARETHSVPWNLVGRAFTVDGAARLLERGAAGLRAAARHAQVVPAEQAAVAEGRPSGRETLQCPFCLTVYDPDFGDPHFELGSGVPVDALPDDYECSVCGAPKAQMIA